MDSCNILITRPAAQAQIICKRLEDWGAKVLSIPAITIHPVALASRIVKIVQRAQSSDIVIFLSANAVTHAQHVWQNVTSTPYIVAIGSGTAAALTAFSLPVAATAPLASSEGLMQLDILKNARDRRVYICSGTPTRPWLAEQLIKQNNTVIPVLCYVRKPTALTSAHIQLLKHETMDYLVVTSVEILSQVYQWVRQIDASHLLQSTVVVIHPKQQKFAEALGFKRVLLAPNGEVESLVNTISADRIL